MKPVLAQLLGWPGGVVIGVGAVIALVSVGRGATAKVTEDSDAAVREGSLLALAFTWFIAALTFASG